MTKSVLRVFIVDDHPLVREWLVAALRQQPDIEICGQAEDARSAITGMSAASPDVAIVDLSLKGSSGLDLIKAIGEQLPRIRVVVLSMHEEVFYAERSLRAGARAYVMKRESTGHIVEAIRQVAAGQLYANPDLLAKLTDRMLGRKQVAPLSPVEMLSDRELDVFRRLGVGDTTRKIADDLSVSIKTVQVYCARIKVKFGLQSGAELVREAVRWNEEQQRA